MHRVPHAGSLRLMHIALCRGNADRGAPANLLLQEFQAGGQGPLAGIGREGSTRMACAVPRVCAVLLLPPPPNSPHAPVCHGYSYVALELSNVPSIEVVTVGHL